MATKFNVTVNPFTHKVCIGAKVNGVGSEVILTYDEFNFWQEFEMNEQVFEVLLEYDYELQASISDATGNYPVKLNITLLDEF
jgi:hypothetical protein